MTHFEDLTEYSYAGEEPKPGVLNVGWLGEGQPFQTGETSDAFREALAELCEHHAICRVGGHHACEVCPDASWDDPYFYKMGAGEIRVRGADGVWYVAPRLVIHYVVEHHYRPPPEFIDAVEKPSEIGRFELAPVSDETIREWDRRARAELGPPITDAEIDRIVQRRIRETHPKRPWWRLW